MLDINLLRRDLPAVVSGLARRGVIFDADRFESLESRRKALQVETETLQSRRNALAKQIGQLRAKGEDATAVMAESREIPKQLAVLETELARIQQTLSSWLATLPNLPHDSVPDGQDETA